MQYIISGTNRPGSRSLQVSKYLQSVYRELGENYEVIDLCDLPLAEMDGSCYSQERPAALQTVVDQITASRSVVLVIPEYNGSYPGVLKYFIDHWSFPEAFEYRPVCFLGLGGQFGGLRPVEHMQQVVGYRNAFIYPKRIFLHNVWSAIDENGVPTDEAMRARITAQAQGFTQFVGALESAGLDANSYLKSKAQA